MVHVWYSEATTGTLMLFTMQRTGRKRKHKSHTPPWRIVLSWVALMEEYPATICHKIFFTVSWSQKLKGLFHLREKKRGRIQHYPWIHTANIKGEEPITITFNQTKKGSHEKKRKKKQEIKSVPMMKESKKKKGINHIHLVSVHFIQHTFWPSCGFF